jgi:hypothetical protein
MSVMLKRKKMSKQIDEKTLKLLEQLLRLIHAV